MVGIEHRDELTVGLGERLVQIARLGMRVIGAKQISAAQLVA